MKHSSIDPNATGLVLGTGDFSVTPPKVSNLTVTHYERQPMGPNGTVTVQFELTSSTFTKLLMVRVDATSPHASAATLSVNGHSPAKKIKISGGGWTSFFLQPAFLIAGTNELTLKLGADSPPLTLNQLVIEFGPAFAGELLSADFRQSPVVTSAELAVSKNQGTFRGDHWSFAGGNSVILSFPLGDANDGNTDVWIAVTGLSDSGRSSISLSVNGEEILDGYIAPEAPSNGRAEFLVPAGLCKAGSNTAVLRVVGAARFFSLQSMEIRKIEYYQTLGSVTFTKIPEPARDLKIVRNDSLQEGSYRCLRSGEEVKVSFKNSAPVLLIVECNAVLCRDANPGGMASISVSVNGSTFVSGHPVPHHQSKFFESVFLVPPQLFYVGDNELSLRVDTNSTYDVWLDGVRIREMHDGPAIAQALARAGMSYRERRKIEFVPLMFLLRRASSALNLFAGIVEHSSRKWISRAIDDLARARDDLKWIRSEIDSAFSRSRKVSMSGVDISAGTGDAQALTLFANYAVNRCEQEIKRLEALRQNRPLGSDYTFGCDIGEALKARLAAVSPVSLVNGKFSFADSQTGKQYRFDDQKTADGKREAYCIFLQAELIEGALLEVENASQHLMTLAAPPANDKRRAAFLPALLVAILSYGVASIAYSISMTRNSNAGASGNYSMNWSGWRGDWERMTSWDWMNIPEIGYLKPGGVYSACTGPNQRADISLDTQHEHMRAGGYYNYVYISEDPYPIRLAPKNPVLSPPDEIYHSQLAGGVNVDCAGELQFADGKFRFVNTQSGHYYKTEPDWNSCRNRFIEALKKMGYDTTQIGDRHYTGENLEFLDRLL